MSNLIQNSTEFTQAIIENDFEKIKRSKAIIENSKFEIDMIKVDTWPQDKYLSNFDPYGFRIIFPYICYHAELLVYFGCANQLIELYPKNMKITEDILENHAKKVQQDVNCKFRDELLTLENMHEKVVISEYVMNLLESENPDIPKDIRKRRNKIIKFLLEKFSSYVFHKFGEGTNKGDIVDTDVFARIDYFWKRAYEDEK